MAAALEQAALDATEAKDMRRSSELWTILEPDGPAEDLMDAPSKDDSYLMDCGGGAEVKAPEQS